MMKRLIRLQITRGMHTLGSKSPDKLKKIKTYINNYENSENELIRKKDYLSLLRNIYYSIPSRMNEREEWDNFLNKLKIEKCYLRLKSIIKKNSISYDSLICRQIIFLYYIGFDTEVKILLDKINSKLIKCNENNFKECDKIINEDINDVIKMLYVLYNYQKNSENYKPMFLLFDKYIYYSKKYPINNIKYLFYFHLFYLNMNNSLNKVNKCIEIYRHLFGTEQLMLLTRYINIYLKQLYLYNIIKHKDDMDKQNNVLIMDKKKSSFFINNNIKNKYEKNYNPIFLNNMPNKIENEINMFINNIFRINKNEKEYFVFTSFEDIEIINNEVSTSLIENDKETSSCSENKENVQVNDSSFLKNKTIDAKMEEVTNTCDDAPVFEDLPEREGKNVEGIYNNENVSKKYIDNREIEKKKKIISVSKNELRIYSNIHNLCVKEIFKNVLLNKESINADIIFNSFISNLFKDKYIYLLMDELKNKITYIDEENYLAYLKQVKLLKLYDNPLFVTISNIFFKKYLYEKKYINNLHFADKITYYTDLFCHNYFLQKYILNIYKLNFNTFNTKILKKILAKLFFYLYQNKSLINGFDQLIKTIIIKIINTGSINDIIMVLFTLRQYNFCKSNNAKLENRDIQLNSHDYDVILTSLFDFKKDETQIDSNNNKPSYLKNRQLIYHIIKEDVFNFLHFQNLENNKMASLDSQTNHEPSKTNHDNFQFLENQKNNFSKNIDNLFNMFHLERSQLNLFKNNYLKIFEYLSYRTIIEKHEINKMNYSDKYYDINIIIMIVKQLTKLFYVFLNNVFDAIQKGDTNLQIFECVNNFFNDNPYYYNLSDKKNMSNMLYNNTVTNTEYNDKMKNKFSNFFNLNKIENVDTEEWGKETEINGSYNNSEEYNAHYINLFIVKKEIDPIILKQYQEKYMIEYNMIKNFTELLLIIILDNFVYFEIKKYYFINFFFLIFQNKFISMSIYHYLSFYRIFKNLFYNQINQRERREYIFSETYFNKNKNHIINTSITQIKALLLDQINHNIMTSQDGNHNIDLSNSVEVKCHKNSLNKYTNNPDCFGSPSQLLNIKNVLNIILYSFNSEDIVDIFKSCFLSSFNNYFKDNKKNIFIKFVTDKNDIQMATLNKEDDTAIVNCNDFFTIRKCFHMNDNNKIDNIVQNEKCNNTEISNYPYNKYNNIIEIFEFYYINMIYEKYINTHSFYNKEDYNCYLNFLTTKKSFEPHEIVNLCTMVRRKSDREVETVSIDNSSERQKIEIIIDNIKNSFSTYNNLEFFISYFFFLMIFSKKDYLNDIYKILNEINKIILFNNNVDPFWYLLLLQIIYVFKIKNLYILDLIISKYKNVSHFYSYLISSIKKKNDQMENNNHIAVSSNNTIKYNIIEYLKKNNIEFLTNIPLKDSPFIFDIYIPSKNILFINNEKCLFCDIFIQNLQENLFDQINSKIMTIDQNSYKWLASIS
ncbi:conserved Plasmodium protein, unknown function [Plasmodium vinckei vinckei]|uniref:Uncharacterized protein n=1 Tax=Plasmodium vinckei vinckei TaxID=54757 RepID=A0A449BNL2_PLAVN|nr:conserved Plasmodium protein, unknown function [Plasmodium vinckei vinckei]VEV54992.1 conserved Plasmodium protein, unknown function [Plasmodium vinckei vinckei]